MRKNYLLDLLFLTPIFLFATWIYLIPPFQTFGYHALFSDDAVFAILARKVLETGPSGAFHLAWGPFQPWINALLNKLFNIPLDEGSRIITGIALTIRVIPAYFLVKLIFNKFAAIISIFLITIYPFLAIPGEGALTEGLYSLIIFTGFLFSYLALKYEKMIFYTLSGIIFGLAYLTRLEGWFFIIPLLFLTFLKVIFDTQKRISALKLLGISISVFLLTIYPYLSFIHETFGSWTLNPRMSTVLMQPGNSYAFYEDKFGPTTSAQVIFSGDPKYYRSNLWHPTPLEFWRALGRNWESSPTIPVIYFNFFKDNASFIFGGSVLGLFLYLRNIFKNKFKLVFTSIVLSTFSFFLLDFFLVSMEFLSSVIFVQDRNLNAVTERFQKILSFPDYQQWAFRDGIIILTSIFFIISERNSLFELARHFHVHRLKLFLPLSLLVSIIPLYFAGFATKYAIILGAIFALYTGYFIATISIKYRAGIIIPIIFFGVIGLNFPQFYQTLNTRAMQYKVQDLQISLYRQPGLAILKDYGRPGAKVAVFHEAPIFYAEGIPFFIMADSNISLKQSLSYLEKNQVSYLVANGNNFSSWQQFRPLLIPTTKLPSWQILYSSPVKPNREADVIVWKYIK
ncbi:MAG: Oligosaccharyl transferase STT3 subunit [Berkelbacteria bacterium GW2011_GWA1_36_9]|uniref:Oligosaccharyl transferase STT3 subunit n=1 Tax=Berkelbacteria bacterium GW2011_GWA1_36_9 TaxID=1618331 RepID=A0A0G0FX98_9BACT|nr:MAG: Oligosaccharyl transferase STT3 subunit [Berkelbacteria bacterium GW2011_GWA1_36_9]